MAVRKGSAEGVRLWRTHQMLQGVRRHAGRSQPGVGGEEDLRAARPQEERVNPTARKCTWPVTCTAQYKVPGTTMNEFPQSQPPNTNMHIGIPKSVAMRKQLNAFTPTFSASSSRSALLMDAWKSRPSCSSSTLKGASLLADRISLVRRTWRLSLAMALGTCLGRGEHRREGRERTCGWAWGVRMGVSGSAWPRPWRLALERRPVGEGGRRCVGWVFQYAWLGHGCASDGGLQEKECASTWPCPRGLAWGPGGPGTNPSPPLLAPNLDNYKNQFPPPDVFQARLLAELCGKVVGQHHVQGTGAQVGLPVSIKDLSGLGEEDGRRGESVEGLGKRVVE